MESCPFCGAAMTGAGGSNICPACGHKVVLTGDITPPPWQDDEPETKTPTQLATLGQTTQPREQPINPPVVDLTVGPGQMSTDEAARLLENAVEDEPTTVPPTATPSTGTAKTVDPFTDAPTDRSRPDSHSPDLDALVEQINANPPTHTPTGRSGSGLGAMWEKLLAEVDNQRLDGSQTFKGGIHSVSLPTLTVKEKSLSAFSDHPDAIHAGAVDFELKHKIGEGGMGEVYEGRQTSIDRTIALKMIKSSVADDPIQRAKFLSEAAVIGDLEHPNIVPVYDLGITANKRPFYAMKLVRGTPWNKKINELPTTENLDILLRVADAVTYAHARGVIHRDLKPSNVMLGEFGEVQLMDWGMAASVNENGKAIQLHELSPEGGTPAYMAPEMATGEAEKLGINSDVYLLGAILFEIVTGKRPHGGRRLMDVLENAAANKFQRTEKNGELLDIAYKAMATEPTDRYPTARDFAQAIRHYLEHVQSIGLSERAQKDLDQASASGNYERYAQALFGFRQAMTLWPDNDLAIRGEHDAALAYARCAFGNGDLDLAFSLLLSDAPAHDQLGKQIQRARRLRDARKWRYQLLLRLTIAMAAMIMIVLTVSFVWIRTKEQQAIAARNLAEQQRRQAVDARHREQLEKEKAQAARVAEAQQRQIAEKATRRALAEEAKAVASAEQLSKALQDMVAAQNQEEQAKARAEAEAIMRKKAQDQLAKTGQLLDAGDWAMTAEQAKQAQQQAAMDYQLPVTQTVSLPQQQQMTFKLIPPGEFVMGSSPSEPERGGDEYLHRVNFNKPFYIAEFEMTQAQWRAVMNDLPKSIPPKQRKDALPINQVAWLQVTRQMLPAIQAYAPPGWMFDLPTEAQWEYACRAGTATTYNLGNQVNDLDRAGWYANPQMQIQIQPVGGKKPNAWGLFDMHGNVNEMCFDRYDPRFYLRSDKINPVNPEPGELHIIRGGSAFNEPRHCRSAYRSAVHQLNTYQFVGLRLVLIPITPTTQSANTERLSLIH